MLPPHLPLYSGCGGVVGGAWLFEVGFWGVCMCVYLRTHTGMHSPLLEVQLFLGNVCLALREHDQPWPELA